MYEVGTEITVSYTGYTIGATVIKRTRDGEYSHNGWIAVRQDTDSREGHGYEDAPEDERPEFLVAEEFVSLPGEPVKESPMSAMARSLGYLYGGQYAGGD